MAGLSSGAYTKTYVSSAETTQRRDSQTLFPGLFEQPLSKCEFKKEDTTAARRSRRGRVEQRSVHENVREQRRDNTTKRFADAVSRTF
ncbi:hypothetical protein SAMN05421736_12220 [Evansella caseinilytica]|uniref:Uncharacterized protein n=1 Tax=Evansella caseinilytica TaxID=1503961 RepID=A0A1H3UIT0_9BACI|nr:hypothetical protein SAMN05421736_12220 [Evansella caseinilytica]